MNATGRRSPRGAGPVRRSPAPYRPQSRAMQDYMAEVGAASAAAAESDEELARRVESSDLAILAALTRSERLFRATVGDLLGRNGSAREIRASLERLGGLDARAAALRAALAEGDVEPARRPAEGRRLAAIEAEASALARELRRARGRVGPAIARLEGLVELLEADSDVDVGAALPSCGVTPAAASRALAEVRAAERRGAEARAALVVSNLRVAVYFASKLQGRGISLPDLVQEANIGLMRAAERFDRRQGTAFATYAWWWIRHAVGRAIETQGRDIRIPQTSRDAIRRLRRAAHDLSQKQGCRPGADAVAAAAGLSDARAAELLDAWRLPLSLEQPLVEGGDLRLGECLAAEGPSPEGEAEASELATRLREALTGLTPKEALVLRMRYGVGERKDHTLAQIGERLGVTRQRIQQIEAEALRKLRRAPACRPLRGYLLERGDLS